MSRYDDLGIRRVINAAATLTRLGGSVMPPSVVAAMAEAAETHVDLPLLHERVGERIAALTRNDACFVSSGAAAGIAIAVAACIAGEDPAAIDRFPYLTSGKNEVIIHRAHRNGYDFAARQTGATLVEIGMATFDPAVGTRSSDHSAHRLRALVRGRALRAGGASSGGRRRHRAHATACRSSSMRRRNFRRSVTSGISRRRWAQTSRSSAAARDSAGRNPPVSCSVGGTLSPPAARIAARTTASVAR